MVLYPNHNYTQKEVHMWDLLGHSDPISEMQRLVQRFLGTELVSQTARWRVGTSFLGPSHSLIIEANGDWELHLNRGVVYRGQGHQITVNGEPSESDLSTFKSLYNKLTDRPQDYAA